MSKREILLLEPNYKNKYPPMGLMKIASYYRLRGDNVRFFKGDLKAFAARLLFEEYFKNVNIEVSNVDKIIYTYIVKRGSETVVNYIKTGNQSCLNTIADFSEALIEVETCSVKELLDVLSKYYKRYKSGDFPKFNKVCVTTMFTFYWKETIETIEFAKKLCKSVKGVTVGGIAASLVPDYIEKETGIKPHIGLLDKPFAYDKDKKGDVIIDELPLDYSILDEIDYRYPTENAYFGYMTRGCTNRCPFCAVPKLEPDYCNYIGLKEKLEKVDECFGAKRDLLLMDNNVFASECFEQIINEIKDCGFEKGATYIPPNEYEIAYRNLQAGFELGESVNVFNDRAYLRKIVIIYDELTDKLNDNEKGDFYNRREKLGLLYSETATKEAVEAFHEIVEPLYNKHYKKSARIRFIDFNQGLDARLVTDKKMKKISEIAIRPLRIAFDHWSMKKTYEKAIRSAAKYGIKDLSNYLLYNFNDSPDELYERMKFNIELCEELNVAIYSFPMKYHPIDDPDYFRNRDYIGQPNWNRKFIRAIQAVLNATHGKIGKGKTFFEAAFGKDLDEFHKILWMPEALIIQRYKYDVEKRREYYGDKPTPYDDIDEITSNVTIEWWKKFNALTKKQRNEAEIIISTSKFLDDDIDVVDKNVKEVLRFYQIKRDET